MERDIDRLSPDIRSAIFDAGRMLDEEIDALAGFSFATLLMGDEESTVYYVVKEKADGSRGFAFGILIE